MPSARFFSISSWDLYHLGQGSESFRVTETVICLALFDQLFCISVIDTGFYALALDIGTYAPVLVGAFIRDQACVCQCAVDDIDRALHLTDLVRIFDAEKEISAFVLGDQIGIQGRTKVAYMHSACGAGCISGSDFHNLPFCRVQGTAYTSIKDCEALFYGFCSIFYLVPVEPKPPRSSPPRQSVSSKIRTGCFFMIRN